MSRLDSILRAEESQEFAKLVFSGKVLDLGGEKDSQYLSFVQGEYTLTTVNLHKSEGCDVVHDLEKTPLPFGDASYDVVVLNNTLEHVFHARELVAEAVRVLKKGGRLVITVPFLFPVHPSPHDYWRFTEEAIVEMLKEAGVEKYEIKALGTGVALVSYHFFERLLPQPLRVVSYVLRPLAHGVNALVYLLRKKGSQQKKEYYTLGYFIIGKK